MLTHNWPQTALKIALDVLALVLACWLGFLLRFEGDMPAPALLAFAQWLPVLLVFQLFSLYLLGAFRHSWRHVSLGEARLILTALIGAAAVVAVLRLVTVELNTIVPMGVTVLPLGTLFIDLVLAFAGVMGVRVAWRLWVESDVLKRLPRHPRVRTLLIGAGDCGARTAWAIKTRADTAIDAVGYLDDDAKKQGMLIHGLRVIGTIDELPEIAAAHEVTQILITMHRVSGSVVRRIHELAEQHHLIVKIIPEVEDVVSGRVELSRFRVVAIEDLLRREPVTLESDAVAADLTDRVVVVSGAGGSIGSQLCIEIAKFNPRRLILVEKSENSLFHIHRRLIRDFPNLDVVAYLVDICEELRMRAMFETYGPEVIFHAAAHKHVPMMELHPSEAVRNNIGGTRQFTDLADQYGVAAFVMISTDKAVNPTSVMGCSKRIAELYVQALSQRSKTRFVTVRFGNVLGSNGSVVPIFQEQIANGGPVTVTHPDMTRYFMTIPEACQLVLQAGTMGAGGEIFILDMGKPVKIVDLARDLIRLSGLEPDRDIEIEFVGMRQGEKLYEELSLQEETANKTRHPRIFVGQFQAKDWLAIVDQIDELQSSDDTDPLTIHRKLNDIVPEYQPSSRKHRGESEVLAVGSAEVGRK